MKSAATALLFAFLAGCAAAPADDQADATNTANATASSGGSFGGTGAPPAACGDTGKPLFQKSVCACDDYLQAGILHTSSPNGPADVGVNGKTYAVAGTHIAGSWTTYAGIDVGGIVDVDTDVVTTGDFTGIGKLHVGHDFSVGGDLLFGGYLYVDGTLRADSSYTLGHEEVNATGSYVAPAGEPCACGASEILDVPAAIAAASKTNDNVKNGLAADGLDLMGLGGSKSLTAGSYYVVDGLRLGSGKVRIEGAVKLYVGNALVEIGKDHFELASGATLDLFVEKIALTVGALDFGNGQSPDAFRLYMGGDGSATVGVGETAYHGMIYAPKAEVVFAGVSEVDGALFAKDFAWGGTLDVVYTGGAGSSQGECAPPTGVR